MILEAVREAHASGARLRPCAKVVEVDVRTLRRWVLSPTGDDQRRGPRTAPHNRLSTAEQKRVLELATSPEYRDLSPKQIVPRLADSGSYVASESTFYRLLRGEKLLCCRGPAKARESRRVQELVATGPNQVWSWDITYLRSPVRGVFYYLYLIVDVWSRKIVGARVEEYESSELASALVPEAIEAEGADATRLALHQDNGAPMKGSSLKATLEVLGVLASYSRPGVSNDNPYSESLFRTLKYRPAYPRQPFSGLEAARAWVGDFVAWYNHEHLHSGIGFVTPSSRHAGDDVATLQARRRVYEAARTRHPERWSGGTRSWAAPAEVVLNPTKQTKPSQSLTAQAA